MDSSSSLTVYSLSTVATTFQVSVNEAGIVNQSGNINGFAATVTAWSRGSSQVEAEADIEVDVSSHSESKY